MKTPFDYNIALSTISTRIAGLGTYANYNASEMDWENYRDNIYLPNYNPEKQTRIIFCESGPETLANYMFLSDSLDKIITAKNDKYLQQIYNGVFPLVKTKDLPTRRNALIQLAEQNVLILDILPTHRIKLNTNERRIINALPFKNLILDLPKILGIAYIPNADLNYVFAVPLSLYALNFIQYLLPANFIDRGNLNIGQGHAPSRYELERLIIHGLF